MSKQNQYDNNGQQQQTLYPQSLSVSTVSTAWQQVNLRFMARTKIYKVGKNE